MSEQMRQERPSQDVSYDVYVKLGVDHMGRPEFSDAIAHFKEQDNAVAYKRQLEARGEIVYVHTSAIYGFSEAEKEEWFMDYEPEAPLADASETSESAPKPTPGPPLEGGFRVIRQTHSALVQEVVRWLRRTLRCLKGKEPTQTLKQRI